MYTWFRSPSRHRQRREYGLLGLLFTVILVSPVQAEHFSNLTLDSGPFRSSFCQRQVKERSIRIKVARHRDLVIHRVLGQYIPHDPAKARRKDYTYFITLEDLSNGTLTEGAIAFRSERAVIYTTAQPRGISRVEFLATLPHDQRSVATHALDTFLQLHPILNAAVDACRAYPPTITYDTDDEIDRIEAGQLNFYKMANLYNDQQNPQGPLFTHETGMLGGFFDPDAGRAGGVSYHALNPLEFYVPPKTTWVAQ